MLTWSAIHSLPHYLAVNIKEMAVDGNIAWITFKYYISSNFYKLIQHVASWNRWIVQNIHLQRHWNVELIIKDNVGQANDALS